MSFTNNSEFLISVFAKQPVCVNTRITKNTRDIIKELYADIKQSHKYLIETSDVHGTVTKLNGSLRVPKPRMFKDIDFPDAIIHHINSFSLFTVTYTLLLFNKKIHIIFVLDEVVNNLTDYNKYIDLITMWMFFVNKYSTKGCDCLELTVYFYFTNFQKLLPIGKKVVLDRIHVNTGFTRNCSKQNEIVIFRKEDWFKVFIHESFHCFNLDFSHNYNDACSVKMQELFAINAKIYLFEAYTEFWANILNILFCSFIVNGEKNAQTAVNTALMFIELEKSFSLFQMVKILNYMGLSYRNLILKDTAYNATYIENTNVFSYYIIKTIMLLNFQEFLQWCEEHNTLLLKFNSNQSHQLELCKFIKLMYNSPKFINQVIETELLFKKLNLAKNKRLMFTMKMCLLEIE
jgi:hypothetical protein